MIDLSGSVGMPHGHVVEQTLTTRMPDLAASVKVCYVNQWIKEREPPPITPPFSPTICRTRAAGYELICVTLELQCNESVEVHYSRVVW